MSPYPSALSPGSELKVCSPYGRTFTSTVVKCFPSTRGLVVLTEHKHGSQFVVKLFDPRYLSIRSESRYNGGKPRRWRPAREAAAVDCEKRVRWGNGAYFPQELSEPEPDDEDIGAVVYRAMRWEKHFQQTMQYLYDTELEAYRRLRGIQGQAIPKLYGYGHYQPSESERRYFKIPALVLEYVGDVTVKKAKPEMFDSAVVLQVQNALEYMHKAGVLHKNLNEGHIILTHKRAVLIDFGLAVLRKPEQTWDEWDTNVNKNKEWPNAVIKVLKAKRVRWKYDFVIRAYSTGFKLHSGRPR